MSGTAFVVGFAEALKNSFVFSSSYYNGHGCRYRPESTDCQMKVAYLIVVFLGSTVLSLPPSNAAEFRQKPARAAVVHPSPPSAKKELAATRRMLIERMKASREGLRDALPLYEDALKAQRAEVEAKKKLYEQDLVSKLDLDNSQQALADAEMNTERVRHWIAEDDLALSFAEENTEAEMKSLRNLTPDAYDEGATWIRYNGVTPWSPAVVAKVAKFFEARFGKELPVSAIGQSSTHDRLGYDHREAVDVAVSPQSREGRGLIAYLRQARIPFLAFRGKVPGVSTGPHIHIGLPSPRLHLVEAEQRAVEGVESMQSGQGG